MKNSGKTKAQLVQELEALRSRLAKMEKAAAESKRREDELEKSREELEQRVEEWTAQLLQSQKMEAIGQLAGGVAHDFNNLLTTIRGFTELLMLRAGRKAPEYNDLHRILSASDRAADLVRQLLLFSRKQTVKLVQLDPNHAIENLLKMLGRLIGENVEVNLELGRDLWAVRADPSNLEQVIMNLAVNARDAMPQGGRLTIRTENVTLNEKQCKAIPSAQAGSFVRLSVADTGVGMDEETVEHIFEPFFTTKEAGKGTGLGLSVVYGVVEQHGGWMHVETEPNKGSTFSVYLPASFEKEYEKAKKDIAAEGVRGSGERVLLVEDEGEILKFVTKALRDNGYVVFEATNAQEALSAFEKEKRHFDVIFTDCVLPDKTGLQLVEQLLSRKPDLRVVMTSGYTDDRSQWTVVQEKGFGFLQKPYGIASALQAVRDAIGRGG